MTLPPVTVEALRRYRKTQAERRLVVGSAWHDLDLVFDRGDGQPFYPDDLSHALTRAAAKAGAPGVRLHDLRHGFATMLLAAGVHPKIASEALGHASVAITLDTYSHVLPTMGDVAAQAIQTALGSIVQGAGE